MSGRVLKGEDLLGCADAAGRQQFFAPGPNTLRSLFDQAELFQGEVPCEGLSGISRVGRRAPGIQTLFPGRGPPSPGNLAFAHIEGCLDPTGTPPAKPCVFRGGPGFADGPAFAGSDVIPLANNHPLDGGRGALANARDLPGRKGLVTVDTGADLVIGHHPRVPQGVEFHRGKPIVHSPGNFPFDNPRMEQKQSAVLGCDSTRGRSPAPSSPPSTLDTSRPARPPGPTSGGSGSG